jgi:hypothetical protein
MCSCCEYGNELTVFLRSLNFLSIGGGTVCFSRMTSPRNWLISMIGAVQDTIILSEGRGGGGVNTG